MVAGTGLALNLRTSAISAVAGIDGRFGALF